MPQLPEYPVAADPVRHLLLGLLRDVIVIDHSAPAPFLVSPMGSFCSFARSPSRLIPSTSAARVRLPFVCSSTERISLFSISARDMGPIKALVWASFRRRPSILGLRAATGIISPGAETADSLAISPSSSRTLPGKAQHDNAATHSSLNRGATRP